MQNTYLFQLSLLRNSTENYGFCLLNCLYTILYSSMNRNEYHILLSKFFLFCISLENIKNQTLCIREKRSWNSIMRLQRN